MARKDNGLVGGLFGKLGQRTRGPGKTEPFDSRPDLLSDQERSFYGALNAAVGDSFHLYPKARVELVLAAALGKEADKFRDGVPDVRVGLLICDPPDDRPLLGVELDRTRRKERSRRPQAAFMDWLFDAAGLKVFRVLPQRGYGRTELASIVDEAARVREEARAATQGSASGAGGAQSDAGPSAWPDCPKCGVPMVPSAARWGANMEGRAFACRNYPRCKEFLRLSDGAEEEAGR